MAENDLSKNANEKQAMSVRDMAQGRCRICCKCGASFTPTGKGYQCPQCKKAYDLAWRTARKAAGLSVSGTRMPRDYHRKYEQEYGKSHDVKMRRREIAKARSKDPVEIYKNLARRKLRNAVSNGEVSKMPCEVCGDVNSQGHHHDYEKPLDVTWLCPIHHAEAHHKAEGRSNG